MWTAECSESCEDRFYVTFEYFLDGISTFQTQYVYIKTRLNLLQMFEESM